MKESADIGAAFRFQILAMRRAGETEEEKQNAFRQFWSLKEVCCSSQDKYEWDSSPVIALRMWCLKTTKMLDVTAAVPGRSTHAGMNVEP
jgi:hypothetical protein